MKKIAKTIMTTTNNVESSSLNSMEKIFTQSFFAKQYDKVSSMTFLKKTGFFLIAVLLASLFLDFAGGITAYAMPVDIGITIGDGNDPAGVATTLQVLFLLSIIALAPSLLVMLTGFVRIIIVLSFVRQAMATQQMPPNQVMIGIALFLTIFIMTPTFNELNQNALQPFAAGEMSGEEALAAGMAPIRQFMWNQVAARDLGLFLDLAGEPHPEYMQLDDVGNHILIPAFILSELTMAFMMGFFLYLPFIVIDMVVASILMAMGMMMLPPAMISLPFKIMTFLLAGGWSWIIRGLMLSFYGVGWYE